ncbi:glycoside hydrolase family 16 protein [Sphingomonas sp. XXL09]|uniref:glycoside hydrolase family 16 protein n=1 Tax=Sphingomonas sp. XXL09 TaxID=3457787 RepID=UPI00406BA5C5
MRNVYLCIPKAVGIPYRLGREETMGLILAVLQAASLGAANYAVDVPMVVPEGAPSFADEFRGGTVDAHTWRFDTSRNAVGWFNNERQYYARDRSANARIEEGALVIEARHERATRSRFRDAGGQDYTSAKLVSRQPLGYGFFEIRAKLPCGRGAWPAIWLLPSSGSWPDRGEIDVMEMVGWDPNVIHATLHSGTFNHRLGTQRGAERHMPTSCTAYHRYQLDWRPGAITIGVDGHGYMRVAQPPAPDHGAWPFTRPYNLILNVAIGGDWGGQKGIDDAAFPQAMRIDYVRYWKAQ